MKENSQLIWKRLVKSFTDYSLAFEDFSRANDKDRVGIMKEALHGKDRQIALMMLQHLSQKELIQLFNELVFFASFAHGSIQYIRNIILGLPRDWVLQNIEAYAEPLLTEGTYDEYRRFLELYIVLDNELTLRLAQHATVHSDPDIREAGEDFLGKLGYPTRG
jgi:hypothetical protein